MDKNSLMQNVSNISNVQGTMLSKKDGLLVENRTSGFEDPNMLGAVLSSMYTEVDSKSKRMQRGKPVRFTIETETDVLSVSDVNVEGENLLLLAHLSPNNDLDLVNSSLDLLKG
ncbi:MAG: roadblock/LC7 domain-containing protein [Candidatus Sericytochromatia bacterium]